jgi:hypothetical protein
MTAKQIIAELRRIAEIAEQDPDTEIQAVASTLFATIGCMQCHQMQSLSATILPFLKNLKADLDIKLG